jgi:hypothetical protein
MMQYVLESSPQLETMLVKVPLLKEIQRFAFLADPAQLRGSR